MSKAAPLFLALGLVGCTTNHVHVFAAYRYEPSADCLESPAVVDVIDGPGTGMCAMLRCWLSPGGDVYVTDAACDAPPHYVDQTSDMSDACVKALAAYGRADHGRCAPGDGGG